MFDEGLITMAQRRDGRRGAGKKGLNQLRLKIYVRKRGGRNAADGS